MISRVTVILLFLLFTEPFVRSFEVDTTPKMMMECGQEIPLIRPCCCGSVPYENRDNRQISHPVSHIKSGILLDRIQHNTPLIYPREIVVSSFYTPLKTIRLLI